MIAEDFVIPRWVRVEDGATDKYARFLVEPFERGYGTTIGNSMRRVLLASLSGAAVTAIRIEGSDHEFSAIPGVEEDVTDIVLNLKRCQLRVTEGDSVIFSFKKKGEGDVTAGEIFAAADKVDCLDPDLVVYTSTSKDTNIEMEIKVAKGRGYETADKFELEHAPLGTIYLDANFSPVTKVNFQVEDARVGQQTDYDRLILDVWTNGAVTPSAAVEEAANLIIEHLRIFSTQKTQEEEAAASGGEDSELQRMMSRSVDELELSVRAANCLKAAEIKTLGELVVRSESEMLAFHNFGKKSLDEIKSILESMGLSFEMDVSSGSLPSGDGDTVAVAATEEEAADADEDE